MSPLWSQRSLNAEEWGRRARVSPYEMSSFGLVVLRPGGGITPRKEGSFQKRKTRNWNLPRAPEGPSPCCHRACSPVRPVLTQLHHYAVTERSHLKTLNAWHLLRQQETVSTAPSTDRAVTPARLCLAAHLPRLQTPRDVSLPGIWKHSCASENRFP